MIFSRKRSAMGRNEPQSLAKAFWEIASVLRGRLDVRDYRRIALSILVIKWASDNPGRLVVPTRSTWKYILKYAHSSPGDVLNHALHALAIENRQALGPPENLPDFMKGLEASELLDLIGLTTHISLKAGELEVTESGQYQDLVEQFVLPSGKTEGHFHTPRSVIDLMVRLVEPKDGQSFYDPFMGSGSMLIAVQEYVAEQVGRPATLALAGQEINTEVCTMARMNLLLHGLTDTSLHCGDSLTDPRHIANDNTLMRFDRVLTNPPFSIGYRRHELNFPGRMEYGWTPESGKKADLMHVQHVLASLKPRGIGAVVSPHGVLFRGGSEQEIRRQMILDGRIAGVIGIGPNVFYGTGIPACILVLNGRDRNSPDHPPGVFFVNAEHEITTGRTQNHLDPRHIEKIADTFLRKHALIGFSRWVPLVEIAKNDFNLNIRRYVDTNTDPAPFPDPRAVLHGGVPPKVFEAHRDRFHHYGILSRDLFEPLDEAYWKFPEDGFEAVLKRIPRITAETERDFHDRAVGWWRETAEQLTKLAGTGSLLANRNLFKKSFRRALSGSRVLDEHQLHGAFADWWDDNRGNLRIIDRSAFDRREFQGLLDTLSNSLFSLLNSLVATGRQDLMNLYRSWGEEYALSLHELEERRHAGARRLEKRLQQLGYSSPSTEDGSPSR